MSRSAFDAHTDPLFKNLKILNLESIYKLQIGKFMYQYRSGLLPYSFNNMFLVTRQVHSYGTRSSELFYLPQCRTNIRKFSISFQGPKFFNSLSFEIRNATNTASFCCIKAESIPLIINSNLHIHKNIYVCIFYFFLFFFTFALLFSFFFSFCHFALA